MSNKDIINDIKTKKIIIHPLESNNISVFSQKNIKNIVKPIFPSILYDAILELFSINKEHFIKTPSINSENKANNSNYTILIAEDNKTNQFIAKTILEKSGYKIKTADNGKIAVEIFTHHKDKIDLILMDLHMPIMNGYEATKEIRKTGFNIPIIAMTADAIHSINKNQNDLNFECYITKPFNPEDFIKTISSISKKDKMQHTNPKKVIIYKDEAIKMLDNNESLYLKVLKVFLEENKDTSLQIKNAIHSKDYILGQNLSRKLKGSLGSIGAKQLKNLTIKLQSAFENENSKKLIQLYNIFENDFKELKEYIEKLLS